MLIDTKEAARRLRLSRMRVVQLLGEGRIPNAIKIGGQRGMWVIEVPDDGPPKVLPPEKNPA
jgi:excisionase family DNA binding protein